jgi:hypothetical protein
MSGSVKQAPVGLQNATHAAAQAAKDALPSDLFRQLTDDATVTPDEWAQVADLLGQALDKGAQASDEARQEMGASQEDYRQSTQESNAGDFDGARAKLSEGDPHHNKGIAAHNKVVEDNKASDRLMALFQDMAAELVAQGTTVPGSQAEHVRALQTKLVEYLARWQAVPPS